MISTYGFTITTPRPDSAPSRKLTAREIRDVTLDATHANLLAMILFVAKHGDDHARKNCTFGPVEALTSPRGDVR